MGNVIFGFSESSYRCESDSDITRISTSDCTKICPHNLVTTTSAAQILLPPGKTGGAFKAKCRTDIRNALADVGPRAA